MPTKTKIIIALLVFFILPISVYALTTQELQQQITDKNKQVEDLQKEIAVYQQNIRAKQQEALTLKNET
ncbi:MAG: hypothetical protein V1763_00445, partial [Parcubacteria group bacterium]